VFGLAHAGGNIYATYSGSQIGVTIRDAGTLAQSNSFSTANVSSGLAAAGSTNMFITSGSTLYEYNTAGALEQSYTFPDPATLYNGATVSGNQEMFSYMGDQMGFSVRDANLNQINFVSQSFVPSGIAAGNNTNVYETNANSIYDYSLTGTLLDSETFPDPAVVYGRISYLNGTVAAAFSGDQTGFTIRDGANLSDQLDFVPTNFVINGICLAPGGDVFVTSANSIYEYDFSGDLLNQFTFPDPGIVYGDITYAVPEPSSFAALFGCAGLAVFMRRRRG
jgi:hypothetical protein